MTSKSASFLTVHRKLGSKSLFMKPDGKKTPNSNKIIQSQRPQTSKETTENDVLPHYILHEVDHYKQRFNWDCGVSCVLMLLPPDQQRYFLDNFSDICQEEGFEESTWTIDLCYLLKRFDIKHRMYSTIVGVNEDLGRLSYYDKIMVLDRNRIQQRFEEAAARSIDVLEGELTDSSIVKHLAEHGPIIVLVDNGLLVCDLCKHNKLKYEFRKVFTGTYCGHYILLVGYSRGKLLYRDPALSTRVCAASPARIAAARVAPGTDQDLVLVYNSYR